MEKKYDYSIIPENNWKTFKQVCALFEILHPEVPKKKLLIDVDGTTIQVYGDEEDRNEVIVYDDYDIGAVYIKSDIELPIFEKKANVITISLSPSHMKDNKFSISLKPTGKGTLQRFHDPMFTRSATRKIKGIAQRKRKSSLKPTHSQKT